MKDLRSVNFIGPTVNTIQASGVKVRSMALVFGNLKMEMYIWDSGIKVKYKDMAFI
jgi:hypothetical protein